MNSEGKFREKTFASNCDFYVGKFPQDEKKSGKVFPYRNANAKVKLHTQQQKKISENCILKITEKFYLEEPESLFDTTK